MEFKQRLWAPIKMSLFGKAKVRPGQPRPHKLRAFIHDVETRQPDQLLRQSLTKILRRTNRTPWRVLERRVLRMTNFRHRSRSAEGANLRLSGGELQNQRLCLTRIEFTCHLPQYLFFLGLFSMHHTALNTHLFSAIHIH